MGDASNYFPVVLLCILQKSPTAVKKTNNDNEQFLKQNNRIINVMHAFEKQKRFQLI